MKTDINTDELKHLYQRLLFASATFIKWLLCSLAAGVIIGLIGTLFYRWLSVAASFRESHPYMLFFLPAAGIVIVFLYRHFGEENNTGTNLVITAIHSNDKVPVKVTPLIIVSTVLTHLCGGSAGREGAALQVGGSIGNYFADLMNFDDKDTRIMIMCGMSACFSALFGTPVAAAIFSMEVVSVGVMYYAALVPCVISALMIYRYLTL
jgi:H+/Cl- antiporter ClcA